MTTKFFAVAALMPYWALFPSQAQAPASGSPSVPIYSVTAVSRNLPAINYEHRGDPTKIDFKGTVLLPSGQGEATVESKKGRIEIEAKFEHLGEPQGFGLEYLVYVLWAITPEGRPVNLGEVMPGSSDKAELHVTTDLQAFGLILTAEPYYSVSRPSDVVVMENAVRPDTIGSIQPVNVKYDLMPRGQYKYNVPTPEARAAAANAPKVSMDQYEALTELYQAQNAVQIALSVGADRYAADTYNKAVKLLQEAQERQARKMGKKMVISSAREATQTAEDARVLTAKRRDEERMGQTPKKDADR